MSKSSACDIKMRERRKAGVRGPVENVCLLRTRSLRRVSYQVMGEELCWDRSIAGGDRQPEGRSGSGDMSFL